MLAQSHSNSLRASAARLQPSSLPARVRPARRAVRPNSASAASVPGAGSFDDSASGRSIDYPYQYPPKQRQQQQQQQQQYLHQHPGQQLGTRSGEETDILWAGYSALEEQVQKHHKRHEALVSQLEDLQAKLHAVQQQAIQPASAWQAASFLLFFLCFINFWGMIANFQAWGLPWAAAKTSATSLYLKQLLNFVVPLTNTVVVLIFCMQAVKAAWACLKW